MANREIKFRGRSLADGLWVYGDLVRRFGSTYITNKDGDFAIDPATAGQYIGRKDKNGKEIYEGDTVKNHHAVFHISGVIEYAEGEAGFRVKTTDRPDFLKLADDLPFKWSEIEVIGNIYENPELLEAKS